MLRPQGNFDRDLRIVLSRPLPAVVALLLGALLGLTGGAALAGGGDDNGGGNQAQGTPATTATTGKKPKEDAFDDQGDRGGEDGPESEGDAKKTPAKDKPRGIAGGIDEANKFAEDAGVRIGVAIAPLEGGRVRTAGDVGDFQAWSTMKVPVIAAFLRSHPQPSAANQQDISIGIEQSSNEGPRHLYQQMIKEDGVDGANAQLVKMLQVGGASITGLPTQIDPSIDSIAFGESRWTPASAATFFRALANGCLPIAADHARLILQHMHDVSVGRWGFFDALPADRLFVKGGWGAGSSGWTVSQIGVLGRGDDGYVVAAMTEPSSEQAGHELLKRVASRIVGATGAPKAGGQLPRRCA